MTHQRKINLWDRARLAFVSSRPGAWLFTTIFPRIDKSLLRLSNGKLNLLVSENVCLLTTTGAKSGLPRSSPVAFVPAGDNIILVASNGGRPRHPSWYYNLRAHPEAELLLPGRRCAFVARETFGEERARLWAKAVSYYAGWEKYKARTGGREIPVFLLTRKATTVR